MVTFLLCCSLVDCWFSRLSISMSRWDDGPFPARLFLSAPPPEDPPAICSEEGAGAREMEEVCGGEGGAGSAGEEPGGRLRWAGSSAFLFTPPPARWAAPAGPVMAQSLVWSTEMTSVEEEAPEEEVLEEEEEEEGCRTSISSWAENLRSRLWMQLWATGASACQVHQRTHPENQVWTGGQHNTLTIGRYVSTHICGFTCIGKFFFHLFSPGMIYRQFNKCSFFKLRLLKHLLSSQCHFYDVN